MRMEWEIVENTRWGWLPVGYAWTKAEALSKLKPGQRIRPAL